MTKLKNPKADLLWEATRRNENYRKGYYDTLKKYQQEYPDQPRENFKRLPSPDTDRWQIKMVGTNPITKNRFCSFYWLDPNIQLEEIWNDIFEQGNTRMHPYNHLFPDEKINDALTKNLEKKTGKKYGKVFLQSYYCSELRGFEDDRYVQFNNYERISEPQNITDSMMLEDFFEFEADNTVYVAIKKENIKDKMLVMIDPLEIDDNIIMKIQEIKTHIIQSLKFSIQISTKKKKKEVIQYLENLIKKISKKEGKNKTTHSLQNKIEIIENLEKKFFDVSSIPFYFKQFKRYDKIIKKAQNERLSSELICINGANCLKDISVSELVDGSKIKRKDYKNIKDYNKNVDRIDKKDNKRYTEAYDNSVTLIQKTPNIFFSPKMKS